MSRLILAAALSLSIGCAASVQTVHQPLAGPTDAAYERVKQALGDAGFAVIMEPNIGRKLKRHFGDKFGKSGISTLRAIIFCNGRFAVAVSNKDPNAAVLCPLHVTVVERNGATQAMFVPPAELAADSPARELLVEVGNLVIKALQKAAPAPAK